VATKRTEDSVRALLDLTVETASRIADSDDEVVVGTAVLEVGDVLMIRPGERIGGDDVVIAGASEVDQAPGRPSRARRSSVVPMRPTAGQHRSSLMLVWDSSPGRITGRPVVIRHVTVNWSQSRGLASASD
jgi:hypothetical protein